MISLNRLWIGTGNGVIISVPLSDDPNGILGASRAPAPVVRVFADSVTSQLTPSYFTPYCSMAQAQLSFHGHRDAVKFFVAVPGSGGSSAATSQPPGLPTLENDSDPDKPIWMLVLSGGEGYIDFRMGAGEDNDDELNEDHQNVAAALGRGEKSHLIVWQVTMPHS